MKRKDGLPSWFGSLPAIDVPSLAISEAMRTLTMPSAVLTEAMRTLQMPSFAITEAMRPQLASLDLTAAMRAFQVGSPSLDVAIDALRLPASTAFAAALPFLALPSPALSEALRAIQLPTSIFESLRALNISHEQLQYLARDQAYRAGLGDPPSEGEPGSDNTAASMADLIVGTAAETAADIALGDDPPAQLADVVRALQSIESQLLEQRSGEALVLYLMVVTMIIELVMALKALGLLS